MKTHVEFEDTEGVVHVIRRDRISLHRDQPNKSWRVCQMNEDDYDNGWPVSVDEAARLRRELLGEGEPESRLGGTPAPSPPVVTGPGVYRDVHGDGWRIAGRDEDGWYAESPDGRRDARRFGDDGVGATRPTRRVTERVADLSAWHQQDAFACPESSLAAMLAESSPAAESEFVPIGWHVLGNGDAILSMEANRTREAAKKLARGIVGGRVVALYRRREDARP